MGWRQVFESKVFLALKETNNVKIILLLHIEKSTTIYTQRNINRLRAHKIFIQWIESLCISKGITMYRIGKDCDLPEQFLYNVKNGHHKYSIAIDVIILISKHYNYPFILSDFLA